MKIAFCLYGLAGGVNDKHGGLQVDYKIAYDYYVKHFFEKYDMDVFIHTWSVDLEEEVSNIYNPKKALFDKQIMFDESPSRKHSIYSRWCSTKKVIKLKSDYEKENGFKYDCVFLTRFDVAFSSDMCFENYNLDFFYSSHWTYYKNLLGQKISTRRFYPTMRNSLVPSFLRKFFYRVEYMGFPFKGITAPDYGGGIEDFWFFSSSDNMDNFSSLFNSLDIYLKSVNLSNHMLAVHHLLQIGLLKKLKFTKYRFVDYAMVRRKFFGFTK